jgi:hypothetical protein
MTRSFFRFDVLIENLFRLQLGPLSPVKFACGVASAIVPFHKVAAMYAPGTTPFATAGWLALPASSISRTLWAMAAGV